MYCRRDSSSATHWGRDGWDHLDSNRNMRVFLYYGRVHLSDNHSLKEEVQSRWESVIRENRQDVHWSKYQKLIWAILLFHVPFPFLLIHFDWLGLLSILSNGDTILDVDEYIVFNLVLYNQTSLLDGKKKPGICSRVFQLNWCLPHSALHHRLWVRRLDGCWWFFLHLHWFVSAL